VWQTLLGIGSGPGLGAWVKRLGGGGGKRMRQGAYSRRKKRETAEGKKKNMVVSYPENGPPHYVNYGEGGPMPLSQIYGKEERGADVEGYFFLTKKASAGGGAYQRGGGLEKKGVAWGRHLIPSGR